MHKKTLLLCTGLSGTGKSYFIKNTLPDGLFYNLKSAATRPMRAGESDGNPYYFMTEPQFELIDFATYLWVNEAFWTPGTPKWLYGIPETEIVTNLGHNLTYDVIQPKYAQQLKNWFLEHDLGKYYNIRTAFFEGPDTNLETAAKRANMPNDLDVRRANTCTPQDFADVGLNIDYHLKPRLGIYDPKLTRHIAMLEKYKHDIPTIIMNPRTK